MPSNVTIIYLITIRCFCLVFPKKNGFKFQYKKYNADFLFSNSYFRYKSLYLPT